MRTSSSPAATASSTTYWIAGRSTTGSISLGVALVAGRNLVPSPAAGITAFTTAGPSSPPPRTARSGAVVGSVMGPRLPSLGDSGGGRRDRGDLPAVAALALGGVQGFVRGMQDLGGRSAVPRVRRDPDRYRHQLLQIASA